LCTSAENILPKHLNGNGSVGKLSFENRLDINRRATPGSPHHKRAQVIGQRKVCFIRHCQNVSDLGGPNLVGDALAALEADALGGNRLEASAIVQLIALRIPKNAIDIEKIVPQELFNAWRSGALGHVGVIFDAPEIEQNAVGANAALNAAESICRKTGIPQLTSNLLNGTRAGYNDVDVGWLRFNSLDALEQ
jgi:hypothetical protein